MTQEELKEQSEQIADLLMENVNYSGNELADIVVDKLLHSHRTLQQSAIRTIYQVLRKYADYHDKNPDYHDARNEGAVDFARKVKSLSHVCMPLI